MYKYKIYFIILLTLISVLITFQDENVLSEEPDCPEVHPGYLVAYHDDERYRYRFEQYHGITQRRHTGQELEGFCKGF